MLEKMIAPACVTAKLSANSKKQAIHDLAGLVAKEHDLDARKIVDAVMQRERLGSTGIGSGVAIPHARIAGIDEVKAGFALAASPIDYDAIDDRPVDLIMLLLAPDHAGADHLKALAMVSRLLRREDMRKRLRAAPDDAALHILLTNRENATKAA